MTPIPWMLFCEQRPRWSRGVRDELVKRGDRKAAARVQSISAPPAGLAAIAEPVLLAFEVSPDSVAKVLGRLVEHRRPRNLATAVLSPAEPLTDELRIALHEAGAVVVASNAGEAVRLVGVARRLAERYASEVAAHRTIGQQVWARLPWQSTRGAIGWD